MPDDRRNPNYSPYRQAQLDATRETMKRVLLLVSGMEKFRPIGDAFTCLNNNTGDLVP